MATATADIAAVLPKDLKEAFEKHYAKAAPIHYSKGYCSRCGASIPIDSEAMYVHKIWHKNTSCQMWMISRFPQEHMHQHQEEGKAIGEIIGAILGFIDPPDEEEPVPFQELRGDDKVIPPHTHKDGTTHAH